jgi:hypothetical protein
VRKKSADLPPDKDKPESLLSKWGTWRVFILSTGNMDELFFWLAALALQGSTIVIRQALQELRLVHLPTVTRASYKS